MNEIHYHISLFPENSDAWAAVAIVGFAWALFKFLGGGWDKEEK